MTNKNNTIEMLKERVANLSRQLYWEGVRTKMYKESFEKQLEKQLVEKRTIMYEAQQIKDANYLLEDLLSSALDYIFDLEGNQIVETENAGPVTFEEIARLLIDDKPLDRIKLVPVKIGVCIPSAEALDEKPAEQ